jgi:hypothetical protein
VADHHDLPLRLGHRLRGAPVSEEYDWVIFWAAITIVLYFAIHSSWLA